MQNQEQKKLTPEEEKAILFSAVTNISRARRLAKALIGPFAQVKNRNGVVQILAPDEGTALEVFGEGPTFKDAFSSACVDLSPKDILDAAGPELRAIHSADARAPKLLER